MRRESSDSPATLFRRLLMPYAVLTVSAGAELDFERLRKDEGAGNISAACVKPQWCNGNLAIRLVELVEAKRDMLFAARLTRLCQTIHEALYCIRIPLVAAPAFRSHCAARGRRPTCMPQCWGKG